MTNEEKCSGDVNTCRAMGGECTECGARDCLFGEPLHYHHDGCPACEGSGFTDNQLHMLNAAMEKRDRDLSKARQNEARQIFAAIWELEYDGLDDKPCNPRCESRANNFWRAMRELKKKFGVE